MTLATKYPIIFWNAANLIVDSGSMNIEESLNSEDVENSTTNYGKIATAIGKMKSRKIKFSLPNINKSEFSYSIDVENNNIISGLRGITRIGNSLIKDIMQNRPYSSIEDFLSKVKINKVQMFNLIKSGCFDGIYNNDRQKAIDTYVDIVSDKKSKLTLSNLPMLIEKELIPQEQHQYVQLFNFNKYLKKRKKSLYYLLDDHSFKFYSKHFDTDILQDVVIDDSISAKILQKDWDKIYKKSMEGFRQFLIGNQEQLLNAVNNSNITENKNKYLEDNYSAMEMASLGFYYHNHELANLKTNVYNISDFESLPDGPVVENSFETKDGSTIKMYKLNRIAGTVIDKDKNHSTITLLTTSGVTTVKIYKNSYAKWDRKIAQVNNDGSKTTLEDSWFTRGNKLIITGIRRGNEFVPKKYKSTRFPLFEKIISLDEQGYITCSSDERIEVD